MDVIKVAFCHPKKLGNSDVWVFKVLLAASFDIRQSIFKLVMKSNAYTAVAKLFDVNPLTHLWCTFPASRMLACSFPEYFKLAKITMIQVLGNVEDKQCFKLCN